jgi:hypothetical protein
MSIKARLSLRALLLFIAVCGVVAWLARSWLFPDGVLGQRFALIGPIDIDRDGRDDRGRLKWMIFRNGGTVDYDLPGNGPAVGRIKPGTTWYVVDARLLLRWRPSVPRDYQATGKAIREARLAGIRPMPIERLLDRLGGKGGWRSD